MFPQSVHRFLYRIAILCLVLGLGAPGILHKYCTLDIQLLSCPILYEWTIIKGITFKSDLNTSESAKHRHLPQYNNPRW